MKLLEVVNQIRELDKIMHSKEYPLDREDFRLAQLKMQELLHKKRILVKQDKSFRPIKVDFQPYLEKVLSS